MVGSPNYAIKADQAINGKFNIQAPLIYNERYATREIAKQSIFEYIEVYYNRVRRHSTIGFYSPMVFEEKQKIVKKVCL